MVGRISTWTARKLSYAGRVQLVQSVLFGIQAYWAQIFVLPTKVMKIIEAHCRSYVWSGVNTITKRALVAWDKVCTPKYAGGINLTNLKIWNRAAIAKNSWDVAHKEDKLWIRWIHTYYIKEQNFDTMPIPQQACWMVRKLLEARSVWLQHPISHTSTKQSLIRHIYLQLLGNLPRAPWKTLMFRNRARPKAIITMWLMLQERLPTVDRLIDWGINADPVCSLCSSTQETRDHLFADCALTKQLWNKLLKLMNRPRCTAQSWDQMLHWVIANGRGKSSAALLFRLIYA
ncbi:uncharacterized protein LOC132610456 [Lycium barbarum]|uniref:uncharacterized protein LOC132610456 n=1 Tax=Lycium barbarum TaxID=112863 RepID=UPI00293E1F47|nr:uncharacterized protein LOC132610456 [Lycium barbarum]